MVNSDKRKLAISGWLKNNSSAEYASSIKLQKFLFLYEIFSKVKNKQYDLSGLKGYEMGPVFSKVYGDYTYNRSEFDKEAQNAYDSSVDAIDTKIVSKIGFIVESLTENELSELTHKMNIWKAKEGIIKSGEKQVVLEEKDFNTGDQDIVNELDAMYSDELVQNSFIVPISNNNFVLNKNDVDKLSEEQMDALYKLSKTENLNNPVFVDIDEDGRLLID